MCTRKYYGRFMQPGPDLQYEQNTVHDPNWEWKNKPAVLLRDVAKQQGVTECSQSQREGTLGTRSTGVLVWIGNNS